MLLILKRPQNYYALSHANTRRTDQFKQLVRERDRITKTRFTYSWATFHATHIFLAAYERLLEEDDSLRSCIILKNSPSEIGINSVQNGMLPSANARALFDLYFISISPDVCILAPAFPIKTRAR